MIDEELRAGADDHEPACCDDVEEREGPRGAAGPSFWSNHPPRSSLGPSPACHCYCQRQEDLSFRPTKLLAVASAFSALARTYSSSAPAHEGPVLCQARETVPVQEQRTPWRFRQVQLRSQRMQQKWIA